MKKRFVALGMALVMSIGCGISAFGADAKMSIKDSIKDRKDMAITSLITSMHNLSKTELTKIENDISFIKNNCHISAVPTDVEVNGEEIIYEFTYEDDGTISKFTLTPLENGDTQINITEENRHDTLIYCLDGAVIYNGNEVITTQDNVSVAEFQPQRRGYYQYISTTTPPYGKESDYTYKVGTIKQNKVSLNIPFADATRAALEAILVGSILAAINAPAGVTIVGSGLATFCSVLLSAGQNEAPTSRYASFTIDKYYHKTAKSFRVNATNSVCKYKGRGFYTENCTGNGVDILFYECVDHS